MGKSDFWAILPNKLLFLDVENAILVLNVNVQSFQSDLGSIMHQQDLKTRFYDTNVFYLRENAIF